jgi:hypothetical protein
MPGKTKLGSCHTKLHACCEVLNRDLNALGRQRTEGLYATRAPWQDAVLVPSTRSGLARHGLIIRFWHATSSLHPDELQTWRRTGLAA